MTAVINKIQQVLREYTGRDVVGVAARADDDGVTWAVKAHVLGTSWSFQCLMSEPFNVEEIEEVVFTQWPPTQRRTA